MTINPEDVVMFSATELLELYREKRLSPVEVVEAILHHIDTQDPSVNAFQLVDPEAAIVSARESERRWLND